MPKLTVIATMRAQPGKEAALQAQLLSLVAPTRTEAGCIEYDLHRLQDDPSTFVMIEHWTSREALDAHLGTPHLLALGAALPDLLRSPLELQLLDTVSTPRA